MSKLKILKFITRFPLATFGGVTLGSMEMTNALLELYAKIFPAPDLDPQGFTDLDKLKKKTKTVQNMLKTYQFYGAASLVVITGSVLLIQYKYNQMQNVQMIPLQPSQKEIDNMQKFIKYDPNQPQINMDQYNKYHHYWDREYMKKIVTWYIKDFTKHAYPVLLKYDKQRRQNIDNKEQFFYLIEKMFKHLQKLQYTERKKLCCKLNLIADDFKKYLDRYKHQYPQDNTVLLLSNSSKYELMRYHEIYNKIQKGKKDRKIIKDQKLAKILDLYIANLRNEIQQMEKYNWFILQRIMYKQLYYHLRVFDLGYLEFGEEHTDVMYNILQSKSQIIKEKHQLFTDIKEQAKRQIKSSFDFVTIKEIIELKR